MPKLSLAQADIIADETLKKGREIKAKPLTVVVLDDGGQYKVVKREDGCGLLRADIARGKAWGVLGMGQAGRELARRAQSMPVFFTGLAAISGGKLVPLPGGVLIHTPDGELVGSVGVSGDLSEIDEECAVHGVKAAGLVPETGDEA
ncbi:MAG: heme-binding protein [Proteobacteria bacterium]|nr:heme-binding protein [Pseudomonadota bacterium]MBU4384360.1 heme-binding protein [Pseudomonadota bacterium]MBU4604134.1 heme-binding protein [Pseudomonadota bacterium]MCG2764178.1 heme-binding protein [Desulfarculaceae bacterium]